MRRKFKCYRVSLKAAFEPKFEDLLKGNGFKQCLDAKGNCSNLPKEGGNYFVISKQTKELTHTGLFLCMAKKRKSVFPWKRDGNAKKLKEYLNHLIVFDIAEEITLGDYLYVLSKYCMSYEHRMYCIAKGYEQFLKQLD